MHVLFIPSWYPAYPGDMAGCFFREQARALLDHGIKVGVLTPAFRSLSRWQALFEGGWGLQAEQDEGIETLRFHGVRAFSWSHALNMRFWERTGLYAFETYQRRFGRPDVLHVHAMIFGLAWAAAIRRRHDIPFVVTEHSSEFLRNEIKEPLLAYLTKQAAHASRLFAVSRALCSSVQSQVPAPIGGTWTAMPNMVSSRFDTVLRDAGAVQAGRQHRRLLSIAGLHANKGHNHLLQALRLATDAGGEFRLRIGGSGPQERPLRQLAADLGLADRVTFLGHCTREQVVQEMTLADALVISSNHETFGVVAIEALMSGTPVVSTRCGGPEDIIEEGRDGYLVAKNDPTALAQGLLRLSREQTRFDPGELRQRCVARFAEAAFARRHAEVYEEVVACASIGSQV
ncbi:MAG: glycosyltransferase [Proteobacteria bacterium]|nr:glycosyltransferase [Pseudomonadota bacterium]